jgi:hypothetical protein
MVDMAIGIIEIGILISAVFVAMMLHWIFKEVMHLAIHGAVGLVVLFAAKMLFGVNIAITWLTLLVCAIGGVYGAAAILVLNHLKMAFI